MRTENSFKENGFELDPKIERWHQDFEKMKRNWADWCVKNATNYDSATQAWGAFIREHQQQAFHFDIYTK